MMTGQHSLYGPSSRQVSMGSHHLWTRKLHHRLSRTSVISEEKEERNLVTGIQWKRIRRNISKPIRIQPLPPPPLQTELLTQLRSPERRSSRFMHRPEPTPTPRPPRPPE
ncbi:hypothetical protein NPIL_477481 [Nephila pilipes]|uniref:Uncharacterized protein n=1 Tax=Nephila pilipes TaxID=299642 RepID=A0A8X6PRW2_NEPPI|nr:hypothetical protein NPIL_477481 [Nephila pilipes]